MSLSKAEKEDDLSASISKTMTIDKLKNALTQNKIVYSTAKKKADFVSLYISNGLHDLKEKTALKEEKVEDVELEEEESSLKAVDALLNLRSASLPVTNLPKDVEKIPVLEELIMSITIIK